MRVPMLLVVMLNVSLAYAMDEQTSNSTAGSKDKLETNMEETRPEHMSLRQIRCYGRNREFLIRSLPFLRMAQEIKIDRNTNEKKEKK